MFVLLLFSPFLGGLTPLCSANLTFKSTCSMGNPGATSRTTIPYNKGARMTCHDGGCIIIDEVSTIPPIPPLSSSFLLYPSFFSSLLLYLTLLLYIPSAFPFSSSLLSFCLSPPIVYTSFSILHTCLFKFNLKYEC